MPRVNPEILRWARETAGLSPEEAADKLKLVPKKGLSAANRLHELESGKEIPSRATLVKMTKCYRRPLLTFYLAAPPQRGDRGQDFRMLPDDQCQADEALLDALIRDVQARQSIVRAVLEDEDEATPLSFVGSMAMTDGVDSVVASIRNTLKVTPEAIYAQDTPHRAFATIRAAAEEAGVFVLLRGNLGSHHTDIDVQTFRGFALADPVAPFVVINEHDSRSAWSFSLLHELTHIWLGQTGVSGERAELQIERFCNDVASQFLLPESELQKLIIDDAANVRQVEVTISDFATERNLSGSLVAYRLFQSGVLGRDVWRQISATYRERWRAKDQRVRELNRVNKPKINQNVVRGHRLGHGLLSFVDRMMNSGALTTTKAGKVLGVRAQQVGPILDARGYGGIRRPA